MKSIGLQIIETYKKHLDIGLNIGSEGNISIRDNQKVYITPSGIDIKDLKEKHISILDLDGIKNNKIKPSSEVDLHLCFIKIEMRLDQLCIVIQNGHQLYLAKEKIFFNFIIWLQNLVVETSNAQNMQRLVRKS